MDIIISVGLIIFSSLIIWKGSEGFEFAADFLGRKLSDGVKGATINAVGSSMPELLTSLIFLVLLGNADGFAGGLGTTAGSAVFNELIIPVVVGFAVFGKLGLRNVALSKKVLLRDGIFLLFANTLLIYVITHPVLKWYHGAGLILFYLVYLVYLFASMDKSKFGLEHPDVFTEKGRARGKKQLVRSLAKLELARLVIGDKKVNRNNAWILLLTSILVMGAACYVLVEACVLLGEGLGWHVYFVSVILAAGATSVPDTILSYKDGLKGNYDDAFSNAFGSNIFDIGFALGLPLMLYTMLFGPLELYNPVDLMEGNSLISNLLELGGMLLIITALSMLIFIQGAKFTIQKSLMLFVIYLFFIAFTVSQGLELEWANVFGDKIVSIIKVVFGL